MLAITLTFTVISSVAFLLIGSIIGYIFKEYSYDQSSRYIPTHPEMFDENGHLIPDEVLAVRFDNPEALEDEDTE